MINKVMTEFGEGTFIKREGKDGFMYYRMLINLDNPDKLGINLKRLHDQAGGLYILDRDVKIIK